MVPITVITPTIGPSSRRLDVILGELRAFTGLPYSHIVSDDGTPEPEFQVDQIAVCEKHGVRRIVNPGPRGLPENLNFALEHVTTPWSFIIEDGVRPSRWWLDVTSAFIDQIHDRPFQGRLISQIGHSHIQDWTMAMAGLLPGDARNWYQGPIPSVDKSGVFFSPYFWTNDGGWSWGRILPLILENPKLDSWKDFPGFKNFFAGFGMEDPPLDSEERRRWCYYRYVNRWPEAFLVAIAAFPGGLDAICMEDWRRLGRYRPLCTLYEGHFGARLTFHNRLSVFLEGPPFLHAQGLGYATAGERYAGEERAWVLPTEEVFESDFGVSHLHIARKITDAFPSAEQVAVQQELTALCSGSPSLQFPFRRLFGGDSDVHSCPSQPSPGPADSSAPT